MGNEGRWWSPHQHTRYSSLDAMTSVPAMVEQAVQLNQPAVATTDHGNGAAWTQLYKCATKAGLKPFPGIEAYLINPTFGGDLADSAKEKRYHFGMLALNVRGYQALVKFTSMTHTRPRFNRYPRATLDDVLELGAEHGEDIAITTGCYFGYAQQMISQGHPLVAKRYIETLAENFPHTFVELQHHSIVHDQDEEEATSGFVLDDDDMVDALVGLAYEVGLPLVAGQDSHYLKPGHKTAHELMKRMVYAGADDSFPGDSFHMASEEWVSQHYDVDVWDQVLEGTRALYDLGDLHIPALDSYKPRMPTISRIPDKVLRQKCLDSLVAMGLDDDEYIDRMDYELGVFKKLKMANYALLCDQFVQWCRSEGIAIEARGSANGSLVMFAIGVTQVDPVLWDCPFERFLSLDRIKPPDVDIDIEDVYRPRAVDWWRRNFNSAQIGTWLKLGARADDDGGSVVVSYRSYRSREVDKDYEEWRSEQQAQAGTRNKPTDKEWEAKNAADKKLINAALQTPADVARYYPQDYRALNHLTDLAPYRSYGVHAGGILLSGDDLDIRDWIPTMLVASSDTTVTQFDMEDVEQWGLVKMDVLGQKSLSIIRRVMELLGRPDPCDFSWIPMDDPAACKIARSGETDNGVFHLEAYTKSRGARELGIRSTADCVLVQALYMPGAMQTGQTQLYNERRRSVAKRKAVTYLHPVFEKYLGPTYGTVVFQEQVLSIMRDLGMDIADINALFKIVKDSGAGAVQRNQKRVAELLGHFEACCKANGITSAQSIQSAWEQLTGIVSYAFNKAHATGYGIRSYRFAYLAAHHPLEFMAAVVEQNAGDKKEVIYLRTFRKKGLLVLPPHINVSGANWVIDHKLNGLRKGLVSIGGLGIKAAESIVANAPYSSITDFAIRAEGRGVSGRKQYLDSGTLMGTVKLLHDAGAFDGLKD